MSLDSLTPETIRRGLVTIFNGLPPRYRANLRSHEQLGTRIFCGPEWCCWARPETGPIEAG